MSILSQERYKLEEIQKMKYTFAFLCIALSSLQELLEQPIEKIFIDQRSIAQPSQAGEGFIGQFHFHFDEAERNLFL